MVTIRKRAKKKLKFARACMLDLAAVQTTREGMQELEQRDDPQGFAAIGDNSMVLINATFLESLLGEPPGALSNDY